MNDIGLAYDLRNTHFLYLNSVVNLYPYVFCLYAYVRNEAIGINIVDADSSMPHRLPAYGQA